MAKYIPKPKRHKIVNGTWRIVHRLHDVPGHRCKALRDGKLYGAVHIPSRTMYLRQHGRKHDDWGRLTTLIHECLHAGDRTMSEEWVTSLAEDISSIIGHYFEIRDRITR